MARTAAFLGAAAILALGGFAALPDDKPEYLGDMPSSLEQPAPERPPAPRSDPGPAAGGPQAPVQGPTPVVPEAPAGGGSAPGQRVPGPAPDTSLDIQAGSGGGDGGGPSATPPPLLSGVLDAVEGLAGCLDDGQVFRPGLGLVECATGVILEPIVPVDPPDPLDPVLDPLTP